MTNNSGLKSRLLNEWEGLARESQVVTEEEWRVRRERLHHTTKGWCVRRCSDKVGTYM